MATSSGTGFLVNSNGWVVTNAHVVEGCAKAAVSNIGEVVQKHVDAQNDLAVVRVSTPPAGVSVLSIRRAPPRLGEDVAALGYPLSAILSDSVKITTGNINSLVGMENDTRYLQISTPIQPGNSGSPLVDKAGNLVGISSASLGAKYSADTGIIPQNVNFAIRASVLELFLQARGVSFQTVETAESPLSTADLAERVSPSVFQILCYQQLSAPPPVVVYAPTSPSPALASPEMKAAAFVAKYHDAWSTDNETALAYMRSHYGDEVDFYGRTISKTALMAEKVKFAKRWPIRTYSVRPESLIISCRPTTCHIEGIVDWSVSSPPRNKTSQGAASFSLDWDCASEIIISENGKVVKAGLRREPSSLISKWHDDNGVCRGGIDGPNSQRACESREVVSDKLYALGWCYGKKDEYGYQMKWHRCTDNSNR